MTQLDPQQRRCHGRNSVMFSAALLALITAACAASDARVVKSSDRLLAETKLLPADAACRTLTDALSSGDYSAQRMRGDAMTALSDEYRLSQAREAACRRVEKAISRAKALDEETHLPTLRLFAWSDGEDEALRKQAASRLLVLAPTADKATVDELCAALPPAALPGWYSELGIEEAIEARALELDAPPTLHAAIERIVSAVRQQRKGEPPSEATLCSAFERLPAPLLYKRLREVFGEDGAAEARQLADALWRRCDEDAAARK